MTTAAVCQKIETEIISRLIDDALAAGCSLAVDNGEERETAKTTDKAKILADLFAVDDERLIIYFGEKRGWVLLIHGNCQDVISDHSISVETIMLGANALADSLQ